MPGEVLLPLQLRACRHTSAASKKSLVFYDSPWYTPNIHRKHHSRIQLRPHHLCPSIANLPIDIFAGTRSSARRSLHAGNWRLDPKRTVSPFPVPSSPAEQTFEVAVARVLHVFGRARLELRPQPSTQLHTHHLWTLFTRSLTTVALTLHTSGAFAFLLSHITKRPVACLPDYNFHPQAWPCSIQSGNLPCRHSHQVPKNQATSSADI